MSSTSTASAFYGKVPVQRIQDLSVVDQVPAKVACPGANQSLPRGSGVTSNEQREHKPITRS